MIDKLLFGNLMKIHENDKRQTNHPHLFKSSNTYDEKSHEKDFLKCVKKSFDLLKAAATTFEEPAVTFPFLYIRRYQQ